MSYAINTNVEAVTPPPVGEAHDWTRDLPDDGRDVLDLAQAVPSEPPAAALRDHLAEVIRREDGHSYTDILGRPELRRAVATHLGAHYGGVAAPEQVAVTAGCNQAFCLAAAALAGPGDEVILPVPYYFNHHMWLEMQGVRPVHLPCDMDRGAVPDPRAAAERISERTRAIVLVSPNNPTGAVYPPATLEAFFDLARRHDLALIVDETYKDFLPEARAPHDLFRRNDWPDALVHLYSFSKTYSLTGHRVGTLTAAPALLSAAAKIADCVMISPPVTGQAAALYALGHLADQREARRRRMAARTEALRRAFAAPELRYRLVSAGAYFAYLRHPFSGESSTDVARRLVRTQKVLSLPGAMFGPGQDDYLRLAFANVDADCFADLVARLVASQRREDAA